MAPKFKGQAVISSWTAWPLKMGPIDCPEMLVETTIPHCVKSQKSADLIHTVTEAWNHASPYVNW